MESKKDANIFVKKKLNEVKSFVEYFHKEIENMEVCLAVLEDLVSAKHRLLRLIERDYGTHQVLDSFHEKLDNLIELRKAKGDWEKGWLTSEIAQKEIKESLWKPDEKADRKNPPGFIID